MAHRPCSGRAWARAFEGRTSAGHGIRIEGRDRIEPGARRTGTALDTDRGVEQASEGGAVPAEHRGADLVGPCRSMGAVSIRELARAHGSRAPSSADSPGAHVDGDRPQRACCEAWAPVPNRVIRPSRGHPAWPAPDPAPEPTLRAAETDPLRAGIRGSPASARPTSVGRALARAGHVELAPPAGHPPDRPGLPTACSKPPSARSSCSPRSGRPRPVRWLRPSRCCCFPTPCSAPSPACSSTAGTGLGCWWWPTWPGAR